MGKSIPRAGGHLGYESPKAQNTKGPRRVAGGIGLPDKTQSFSSTRTAGKKKQAFSVSMSQTRRGLYLHRDNLWFTWNSFNGAPALLTYRVYFSSSVSVCPIWPCGEEGPRRAHPLAGGAVPGLTACRP